MGTSNPLIAALDAAEAPVTSIADWMRAHPDVGEAVLRAVERGVTYPTIADLLCEQGYRTTDDTVRKWAKRQATR